ncbi:AraC family transcriptional regulator [uncultured Winogradskyella sp.]|uniref:helix-turn-helix domain-containing protein n=1 Tax=uncultured Winogradskyella sp. TaxID=395353 RepID=UPI002613A692|nr:AraC family transcriptional regulator [uncultured Winogradskyella sp.]
MEKEIHIINNSAKHFIEIIAKELNSEFEEENRAYCMSFPKDVGHGYIKTYDFDYGIFAYEFDCTLKKPLHFTFAKEVVQPLVILFNREEKITYSHSGSGDKTIKHLESMMACAGLSDSNSLRIPKDSPGCFFAIRIDRKTFEEKIDSFLAEMDNNLEEIFRDSNGVNALFYQGYYSLDIAKYIEEYTTTELTGFMRHVFQEGKIYEILTHYLKQYLDDTKEPDSRRILRQNTVDKIEEASTIIQEEMAVLGSILSIAKRVGLNQNTLQDGFNYLFKKSVNQYIKDVRMDKAKELMENSDLNITEITYKIGINSRSYFSKIFKEKFGISPKQYISKHRKQNQTNQSA